MKVTDEQIDAAEAAVSGLLDTAESVFRQHSQVFMAFDEDDVTPAQNARILAFIERMDARMNAINDLIRNAENDKG